MLKHPWNYGLHEQLYWGLHIKLEKLSKAFCQTGLKLLIWAIDFI